MEKIPLINRAANPTHTDAAQQPKSYGSDGSALKTQLLPPSAPTNPPPLSERQVTLSKQRTPVTSPFPLPKFLQERHPFLGQLRRAVIGRTDDEKSEVTCLVLAILRRHMGVSVDKSIGVAHGMDDYQRESLCRLFCGEDATVLVTKNRAAPTSSSCRTARTLHCFSVWPRAWVRTAPGRRGETALRCHAGRAGHPRTRHGSAQEVLLTDLENGERTARSPIELEGRDQSSAGSRT